MYLSRLILDPRNRRVQKEVAEPYQMHRSIMRAFPEELDSEEERVLFRVDAPRRGGPLTLLAQSLTQPDWSWLEERGAKGYLLPLDEPNPWVKEFDLRLSPHQVLAFRLRANPTVKRKGKRLGLYRDEEQMAWLERKGEQGGFDVASARAGNQKVVTGTIHRDSGSETLRLLSVQFDGLLRVVQPEQLRKTVEEGVGSGKAFGFGLLSLAPPS